MTRHTVKGTESKTRGVSSSAELETAGASTKGLESADLVTELFSGTSIFLKLGEFYGTLRAGSTQGARSLYPGLAPEVRSGLPKRLVERFHRGSQRGIHDRDQR